MKYFYQIMSIVIALFGDSPYASDSMKQFNTDKLEESIYNFISTHNVQGTLAASKAGKIFYSKAQGECSSQKACDTNTQYAIGSVTKQFTAAALLKVLFDNVCERNIELLQKELHKPVINFLNNKDEIWLEGKAPEWSKHITLHHLLSQTSGLPDVTAEEYEEFNKAPHSRQEVIALYTQDKSLNFEPGHEYGYSAANYFIAGVIVEKISGKSLGSYLSDTFFTPANMHSTFLPEKGTIKTLKESQTYPLLAEGYVYSLKDTLAYPMIDYYRAENNQGEGGMISCVEDLIAWNKAFYTTELILPKAVRKLMLAPTVLSDGQIINYAYGVEIDNTDGEIYFHDGMVPGFQSKLVYDSKNDVTFVQLSNISYDLLQFVDYMTRYQAIESSNASQIKKEEQIRLLNTEYPEAENQVNKHSLIDYNSIRESLPDFSALLSLNMHQEKLTCSWTRKLTEENESLKFAASDKEIHFPKPTGSFSVGYKSMELTDVSRTDPYKKDAPRRLKVTIYYPSNDESTKDSYGHEEEVFWKRELTEPLQSQDMTSEEFESVAAEINNLKVFKTQNAAPATGPFPVILFEHGFGVTAGSYQNMILKLVSHGYVVLSTSHPYIADTVIFDDGEEAFLKADRDALMFETAFLDTQFVLSKIDEIASRTPSMDLTKIGMMGHSLGGATTIRTTRINSQLKAGIALDAPVHHNTYDYDGDERNSSTLDSDITLDYGSDFAKPFLHIFAGKPMCDPSTVHLASNNFKATVKDTEHNSFGDHGFLKDNVRVFQKKGWNLGAGNAKMLSYYPKLSSLILAFFDKFLKAAQVDPMKVSSDVITIETTKD